jgi:response regulator RpfG family c-di-GMP phosphodiesterase
MTDKILCVDDDPNVLAAHQRQLRKLFNIEVAQGGERGLEAVRGGGPFSVILSDLRMPGLTGVQFLSQARQLVPDSVRMLLTGYADQQSAIDAVNEGHVFRFLTKPCPPDTLARALAAGVSQYRLVRSEKELLEQTLRGSVGVLTEVLSLVNPPAFGRAGRVQRVAQQLGQALKAENAWQLEVAAMLSQLGCVAVPEPVLDRVYRGAALAPGEQAMVDGHPNVGRDLLAKIPRLEPVAEIIAYQEKRYDGGGRPEDDVRGAAIPLGARILKVALDYDSLATHETSRAKILERLRARAGWYDPEVLDALAHGPLPGAGFESQDVEIHALRCAMVLDQDVVNGSGIMLVGKGREVTEALLHRLRNFAATGAIRGPFKVLVPPGA